MTTTRALLVVCAGAVLLGGRCAASAADVATYSAPLPRGELPAQGDGGAAGAVVVRDPGALDAFFPVPSERRLAEAFVDGLLDLGGAAVALLAPRCRAEWYPRPGASVAGRELSCSGTSPPGSVALLGVASP
ncbi:MAG TPA: hypothetical protein VLS93_12020 [Anaeromyxobacteraceae bacterium]|nr:hypothetical protein [Anaeromyxobacteraceae bacterium]